MRRREFISEAHDQQTATSEILRVISRSQTNVQPVFDAILSSALRVATGVLGCGDPDRGGTLFRQAGNTERLAHRGGEGRHPIRAGK
jgi:hypothetical protein